MIARNYTQLGTTVKLKNQETENKNETNMQQSSRIYLRFQRNHKE